MMKLMRVEDVMIATSDVNKLDPPLGSLPGLI